MHRHFLCVKHSLVLEGFLMYLFMNDFTWMFFCCCNLMMFYDWHECVMSVLGTTKNT